MNRLVKQLLLWLLMAVLPVQGMAAVIKSNCGPQHHAVAMTEQVEIATATQMQDLHGFHDHHATAHGHAHGDLLMAGAQVQSDEANAASPDTQQSGHHYGTYCSACAACCMGAVAPPVSFSATSLPERVEVAAVSPVLSYLGFIPPSLDRPPKPFSA